MSVHTLKDGRVICKYRKGSDRSRPNTTKKYFGRDAGSWQRACDFNESLGLGSTGHSHGPPFTALVDEYLDAKEHSIAKSTYDNICIKMDRVILPKIGATIATEITPIILDKYVSCRKKETVKVSIGNGKKKDTGRPVKLTTIHRELSDIRAVLRWGVKRKLIANNPMEGFDMPKRDDAIIQPPSRPEFDAILTCAVPHMKRAMLISYYTGLRPGKEELLPLTWDSVDFYNRTIQVISADKGGLPVRMVPLHEKILTHLEKWFDEDQEKGIRYIVHYHGHKIDSVKKAWKSAKKRARVTRKMRLYDLRHAFASDLLRKGASLKSVSELLGHSDPGITAKIYQHVENQEKRDVIDMLD